MNSPRNNDYLPTAVPVARLIEAFSRLPGIGPKSAQRLAYHMIRISSQEATSLAEAIQAVKESVGLCSICLNITDQEPCGVCASPNRDQNVVCVVEEPLDLLAIERTRVFRGQYHVLHGAISPLNGVGPDELRIRELLARIRHTDVDQNTQNDETSIREVILATNPNLEGEATAMYLHRLLAPLGVQVTRLARGLSTGGELEYADELTLVRAFEGRQELT